MGDEEISIKVISNLSFSNYFNFLNKYPNNILLLNSITYLNNNIINPQHFDLKIKAILNHFNLSQETIAKTISNLIKKGAYIFVYGNSSTVIRSLILAKSKKTDFTILTTGKEGKKLEQSLKKYNIDVKIYKEVAVRLALKKADLFLMGAVAITKEGKIINKMGSELFVEAADKLSVPVYCCSDSWKIDYAGKFSFENRPETEYQYEIIEPSLMTMITEIGTYSPQVLVEQVKKEYNFLDD